MLAMEYDGPAFRTAPACATTNSAIRWVFAAFEGTGHDPILGPHLSGVLRAAGFRGVETIGIQPYLSPEVGASMLAGLVRALLPAIEQTGTATATEVDLATLETRLAHEMQQRSAVIAPPTLVGAWSRAG